MPAVREAIGPLEVPRFTTLADFTDRPDNLELVYSVLASIARAVSRARPQDAAVDGTGLETTSASAHFVSRAGRKRTKYVKLVLGVLCAWVIPVSLVVDWGPCRAVVSCCGQSPCTTRCSAFPEHRHESPRDLV